MNHLESRKIKPNFLQRRYAIRLGRHYMSAAAGVLLIGLIGYSRVTSVNLAVAQSLPSTGQESSLTKQTASLVVEPKLVAANTKFGFKLFSEILKQDNSKNILISPASVALALAMTYNGASGETQQAIAKTLELQGISLQEVNSANAAMLTALANPDPNVQLSIANSLWAKQGYALKPDFLQKNQNFYKATVTNLDFSDRTATTTINDWVKQSTNGKIDQIIEQINPDDLLFLVNAIYFNGKWTKAFDTQQTNRQPFYLATGEQKHPMMSQTDEYKYSETENFQAVSLPYGEAGRLSLYIFLPKQNSSLSAFYENLNAENWEKWMAQFSDRKGAVQLPRFKIDADLTLNDALKSLGMKVAFADKADFSGIGENLALSEVKHLTFVEVNEAGTEAAAATSARVALIAATPEQEPFQMIVNRPFFSAIRDNQTGTILFMGSIVEPN